MITPRKKSLEKKMERMRRLGCLFWSFFLLGANFFYGQSLLQGKYHRDRERVIDIIHYKADLNFDFSKGTVRGEATVVL
jgi:hypothetical protein